MLKFSWGGRPLGQSLSDYEKAWIRAKTNPNPSFRQKPEDMNSSIYDFGDGFSLSEEDPADSFDAFDLEGVGYERGKDKAEDSCEDRKDVREEIKKVIEEIRLATKNTNQSGS